MDDTSGGRLIHCPRCGNMITLPIFREAGSMQEEVEQAKGKEAVKEGFSSPDQVEQTLRRLSEYVHTQRVAAKIEKEEKRPGPARPRWVPQLGLRKVTETYEELRDFRHRLSQIEKDIFERTVSVFKDEGMSEDRKRELLVRIGTDRRENLSLAYRKTRELLLDEMRGLMSAEEKTPQDVRRVLQIKHAIEKIDSYAGDVLGLR
jgi:hypothetical protein